MAGAGQKGEWEREEERVSPEGEGSEGMAGAGGKGVIVGLPGHLGCPWGLWGRPLHDENRGHSCESPDWAWA